MANLGCRLVAVIILLFVAPGLAHAEKVKSPHYLTGVVPWVILKDQVDLLGEISVKKGKTFLEFEIIPANLFKNLVDIRSYDGKLIATKNTQLIKLDSNAEIWCTTKWFESSDSAEFLKQTGLSNACFQDSDGDGSVDQYIEKDFAGIYGKSYFRKDRILVSPVKLELVKLEESQVRLKLYMGYLGNYNLGTLAQFGTCFYKDSTLNGYGCFTSSSERSQTSKLSLPSDVMVLGARFSILSTSGDSLIIRQITPVRAQRVVVR